MKQTTEQLIDIGFHHQKMFKPHIWKKAKVIMEWLCEFIPSCEQENELVSTHSIYSRSESTKVNMPLVERYDFGRGCGKYRLANRLEEIAVGNTDLFKKLAEMYDASLTNKVKES